MQEVCASISKSGSRLKTNIIRVWVQNLPLLRPIYGIKVECICLVGQIGANENNRTKTVFGATNKDYEC